jgi:hypothetical protein
MTGASNHRKTFAKAPKECLWSSWLSRVLNVRRLRQDGEIREASELKREVVWTQ